MNTYINPVGLRFVLVAAFILLQLGGASARAAALDLLMPSDRPSPWHMETATGGPRQWQRMVGTLGKDRARIERCLASALCLDLAAKPLATLVRSLAGTSERDRIERVNNHFNAFPYVSDLVQFGVRDVWLSPLTFIQTSGDCEDYAIAKYLTLTLSGIPDDRLWLLLARDRLHGADHAVLVVRVEGVDLVLDNLSDVAPLSRFPHYQPVYALNAGAVWRFLLPDASTEPGPLQFLWPAVD